MRGAARIIRSHQERFDGEGFPDRLSGLNIPAGARILALASDYENLQRGVLVQRSLRPEEAKTMILQSRGSRYDPVVVKAFQHVMGDHPDEAQESEVSARSVIASLAPEYLRPGMVVARDLIAQDGFLLLSADHTLDQRLIQQIQEYETTMAVRLTVCVNVIRRT